MTDRYRKKPVEVRAWKIGFDGQEPDWVRKAFDGERINAAVEQIKHERKAA